MFGQLLSPEDAKRLVEQVAALETQYKKQLIDDVSVQAQLTSLKIDSVERQALISRWAAMKTKPTTTGEYKPI